MKIILASESKFKRDILNKVGLKHTCIKSSPESHTPFDNPYEYVMNQSKEKIANIAYNSNSIYIGLDTIVLINNKVIEKPKTIKEAKESLRLSSNNTNKVITGVTLYNSNLDEYKTFYQETLVTFNKIADSDIDYYIENEPDAMYACGFIIETICSNFLNKIEGSFYNILGVPVEKIYEQLNSWNIYLKDLED